MERVGPVIAVMLLLMFVCLLVAAGVESVRQENACWRNGYEMPVNYAGNTYCFGRGGEPEVVALAALQQE